MIAEIEGEDRQTTTIADLAMALLEGIGRLDFQERIMDALKQQVAFDASLVLLYRRECRPTVLFNEKMLPAYPFRSDDWAGVTANNVKP